VDLHLKGKTALVTGSSSGIGAAIAQALAREGVAVVVHGRHRQRAEAVVAAIEEAGGTAALCLGDLSVPDQAEAAVEAARAAFGAIDILVNNVGGSSDVSHPDWFGASLDEWADNYGSNTLAAVRLIKAFVPSMRENGWGRVIQISSRNAISPHHQFAAYGAAKAALNNLTLSLSKSLEGTGVTANAIMPGLIYTPQLDEWFATTARQLGSDDPDVGREHILRHVVKQTVHRTGMPDDIAFVACMLASPRNDFMTGTIFRVDGGATPTL